jgi:hypothetical protein
MRLKAPSQGVDPVFVLLVNHTAIVQIDELQNLFLDFIEAVAIDALTDCLDAILVRILCHLEISGLALR